MARALRVALRSAFLAIVAVGLATAAAPAQQPAPQQQDVPEVPEQELETFAEAYAQITEIRREMQIELQSVDNREEANRLQQEADQEMQGILQDHGLSVERYQEITQVLNADPEQRQEFQEILQEVQG